MPVTDLSAVDHDTTFGVDGRDFHVSWVPSISTSVTEQSIYLLPRGTALDAGTQTPVAVFNDNTTGEWTGNESLIADSKGNPLTSIDYSIYVVSNGFQKIQASTDISIASEGIATSGIPAGKVGAAYSFTMSATGGSLPYSWTAAGLPEGLSMTTGGAISGVPTSSGTFSAVITVEDSASLTNSKPFEITILPALSSGGEHSVSKLQITISDLTDCTVGEQCNMKLTAKGGTSPYTWSASGLPDGLSLSSAGVLSGTPSEAGSTQIDFKVTDSGKRTASLTLELKVNPSPTDIKFTDIDGCWAENIIIKMHEQGIASGYSDNTFMPDNPVTRAEFASLIVRSFKLTLNNGNTFADTSEHWALADINTASYYGIVKGYDSNTFWPNDLITREQMAAMMARALKLVVNEEDTDFSDEALISIWAKPSVAAAFSKGIVHGYPDNSFRPLGNTTRAEALAVLYNAMQ
jgi:hypothetical protein